MKEAAAFVTDFADAGATVPLVVAIALVLLALRRPALSLRWTLLNGAVWGVTVSAKLALLAFSGVSPSGHVAGSTAAAAGLATLCGVPRRPALALAAAVAVVVGLTRLLVGDHTPLEVVLGAAIGLAAAGLATAWLAPAPLPPAVAALAALVLLLAHGTHATWEPLIVRASQDLRATLP